MTFATSTQITKPGFTRQPGPCSRCGGQGGGSQWSHTGYTCFRCRGAGQEPNGYKTYTYPADWTEQAMTEHYEARQAKLNANRDARQARKATALAEAKAAFLAGHPALAELVERGSEDTFIKDILSKLALYGVLTERQVEAVLSADARNAERAAIKAQEAAEALPVPTGKVTITGEIVSVKWQESVYGGSLKMLVKGQGWKVWGSVPRSLDVAENTPLPGRTVTFTATVEASEKDASFGFFKRPTKASVVA